MKELTEVPEGWQLLFDESDEDDVAHKVNVFSVFVRKGDAIDLDGFYIAGNSGAFCQAADEGGKVPVASQTIYLSDAELVGLRKFLGVTPPTAPSSTQLDAVSDALDKLIVAVRFGNEAQREAAIEQAQAAVAMLDQLAEKAESHAKKSETPDEQIFAEFSKLDALKLAIVGLAP
jgi:hypothetical protein